MKMPDNRMNVDTSILPDNVLSYIDKQFYDLVQELTSPNEAKILKIQLINSINSFVLTKNLLEFINFDNADVQELKDQICFKLSNNTFVIKPGVTSNLQYLTNLFNKKIDENQKLVKKRKRVSSETPTDEVLTEEQLKLTIVQSIQSWCNENQEILGLGEFYFRENDHYTITLIDTEKAFITCKCNEKIRLAKFRGKFQLSNYYRHCKSTSCSMLNQLRRSQNEKENTRILSTIASLPSANARALLLSSAQNSIITNQSNILTSSTTRLSNKETTKRRLNTTNNDDNDTESKSKKKK